MLSDAQRRAGQVGCAEATWQAAAQLAAELAAAPVPVTDPILGSESPICDRPTTPGRRPSGSRMAELNARFGIAIPPRSNGPVQSPVDVSLGETALWTNIGHWRLARTEFQAALVALKRAESMTATRRPSAGLRLVQAKALLGSANPRRPRRC